MGSFFENNKIGLSAALIIGVLASALTGGLGLLALGLGAVAFLIPGLFGMDKEGVVASRIPHDPNAPAAGDTHGQDHGSAAAPSGQARTAPGTAGDLPTIRVGNSAPQVERAAGTDKATPPPPPPAPEALAATALALVDDTGKPVNAASDGTQVIVVNVPANSTADMDTLLRSYAADMNSGTQLERNFLPADPGNGPTMQMAYVGKLNGDGTLFQVRERHLLINAPGVQKLHVIRSGEQDRVSYSVPSLQYALETTSGAKPGDVDLEVRSDLPESITKAIDQKNNPEPKAAAAPTPEKPPADAKRKPMGDVKFPTTEMLEQMIDDPAMERSLQDFYKGVPAPEHTLADAGIKAPNVPAKRTDGKDLV